MSTDNVAAETELQPGITPTAEPGTPDAAAAASAAASSAPSYDPEYVASLERYAVQAQQQFEALSPYEEHVRRYATDPEYRAFVDDSGKAFEQFKKSREPQVPPEIAAVRDEIRADLKPIVDEFQSRRQREAAEAQAKRQQFEQENMAYARRLAAERPDLSAENNRGLMEIAAYADALANMERRPVSIEEAYKKMQGRASAPPASPPPSLRSESGAPGIPTPARVDTERYKKDFFGAVVDSVRNARRAG